MIQKVGLHTNQSPIIKSSSSPFQDGRSILHGYDFIF